MGNAIYSVWVGGVEVNGFYLTEIQAMLLADEYVADGYKDVSIRADKEIK
jgi:hypothetical protein